MALTVKGVTEEKIVGPRGEQVKLVMSFKERPKKLVLNKTNVRALAKVLGPETDNWPGASVTLGVEPIKVGREVVPSIRVKSATGRPGVTGWPTGQGSAAALHPLLPTPASSHPMSGRPPSR